MSKRSDLAAEIAGKLRDLNLDQSYGVDVGEPTKGQPYYSISFARARYLDGQVRLYGEKFINVQWAGTINSELPHSGSLVFRTVDDFYKFLDENFG
jgi:hypothetical protein